MVASEQTIERVIHTFRAAADANRNTPLREGNVVLPTNKQLTAKEIIDRIQRLF